jgi:hypothetical protein
MDAIEAANAMAGPDPITAGKVYYIPLNSGERSQCQRSFPTNRSNISLFVEFAVKSLMLTLFLSPAELLQLCKNGSLNNYHTL